MGTVSLLDCPNGRFVHAVTFGQNDVAFGAIRNSLSLAKRYLLNASALLNRIVNVVRVGSKEQVVGVDASRCVASVAALNARRDRPVNDFVREAVRENAGGWAVRPKHSVSLFSVAASRPKPARVGLLDFGKKSHKRVFSSSFSHGGIMSNRPAQVNGRVSHF
jgi:hypothetical protein